MVLGELSNNWTAICIVIIVCILRATPLLVSSPGIMPLFYLGYDRERGQSGCNPTFREVDMFLEFMPSA